MAIKPSFRSINILFADSDTHLAQVVIRCLRAMGFTNIKHVSTAAEAISELRAGTTSFLITEWGLKESNGIDLVRYIRRDPESPNRTLPIIMLTGRGELPEVCAARDAGTTEFVVKPFTVQTLYNRLEQMVDTPRSFILAEGFVGPERRRQGSPPPGVSERRVRAATPASSVREANPHDVLILAPDLGLRRAIGGAELAQLITPETLARAQKAIDALADESLQWVREDLRQMGEAWDSLSKLYSEHVLEQLKEGALSIKSRAGTFGYRMASDVARLLYLFLGTDFLPTNPRHVLVTQKYIEVLKIIIAQNIKERAGVGNELYSELMRLTMIR